jgi:hypothetical protein
MLVVAITFTVILRCAEALAALQLPTKFWKRSRISWYWRVWGLAGLFWGSCASLLSLREAFADDSFWAATIHLGSLTVFWVVLLVAANRLTRVDNVVTIE